MKSLKYIDERQKLWASAHIPASELDSSCSHVQANINLNLSFPISDEVKDEYVKGSGGELTKTCEAGNMFAVYSSSALVVNTFQYWRNATSITPILKALGIHDKASFRISFERQLRVSSDEHDFPTPANLDVCFELPDNSTIIGIESKFREPYGGSHEGLKEAYLRHSELWEEWSAEKDDKVAKLPALSATKTLAKSISPGDNTFYHLDAAQLIKHLLGLRDHYKQFAVKAIGQGKTPTKPDLHLIYLWYDVPFDEGAELRAEIEYFSNIISKDKVAFHALTYQELFISLAKEPDSSVGFRSYINYLVERYL